MGRARARTPVCTVPLTSNLTVTATFGPQTYMFVSSATITPGRLNGVTGADTECATLATAAGLPGTYKAWISDVGVDANTRVGAGGWVRTDGRPFTGSLANLKAGNQVVYYPPRIDENGNDLGTAKQIPVLTGGNGSGANFGVQCTDYTQVTGGAYIGLANAGSGYWAYNELDSQGCQDPLRLYCFRSDATAAVTMPAAGAVRHIFVSTLAVTPTGGLANADAECIADATAAGLATPTKYVALLATSTKSAISRVNAAGTTPWKRADEVIVAATLNDLATGNLRAPIDLLADGSKYSSPQVWSGAVDAMTVGDLTCNDWTTAASTAKARIGYPNATVDPDWFNFYTVTCDTMYLHVICIEP